MNIHHQISKLHPVNPENPVIPSKFPEMPAAPRFAEDDAPAERH
jgi:hypothetical protein